MTTAPVLFDSGDDPYQAWLLDNPRGYVINARRSEDSGTAMVHRAQCPHIRSMRNSDQPGGFTMRNWVKLVGTDLQELVLHFIAQRSAPLIIINRCKACDATPRDLYHERNVNEVVTLPSDRSHSILVNARERDPLARALCIERHGPRCKACGMDMAQRYGALAEGFIDVHELPSRGPAAEFDPQRDMVPVCPNCHSMLHRGRHVPLSIAELQAALRRAVHSWSDAMYGNASGTDLSR